MISKSLISKGISAKLMISNSMLEIKWSKKMSNSRQKNSRMRNWWEKISRWTRLLIWLPIHLWLEPLQWEMLLWEWTRQGHLEIILKIIMPRKVMKRWEIKCPWTRLIVGSSQIINSLRKVWREWDLHKLHLIKLGVAPTHLILLLEARGQRVAVYSGAHSRMQEALNKIHH